MGASVFGLTPTAVRELLDRQSTLLRVTVHELRRPITLIDGYLSLIRDGSIDGPPASGHVQEVLGAIAGSVQEIRALVDGLAGIARQDDQAVALMRQSCRLVALVGDAVAAVDHEARARRIHIAQSGEEVQIDADQTMLRVVLINLLSNAIRHGPVGTTIAVTVRREDSVAAIDVHDDGPGVLPMDVGRIFDPWYQGSSDSGGLGLGLWIVRRLVEWHGGSVSVDSQRGQGSTFRILLPTHIGGR